MRELSESERKLDALVVELYVRRRRSIPHVCTKLRIGQERFYQIVKRLGVQPRGEGGSKPRKIHWSQELLDRVVVNGVMAVSRELGVHHVSLRYRLEHAMATGKIVVREGRAILVVSPESTTTGLASFGVDAAQTGVAAAPTRTTWPSPAVPGLCKEEQKPLPPVEPEPEVYVGKRRVTEQDVRQMLRNLGEEELQAYDRGETPRSVVYERTRVWLRERIRAGITR